jgi:hypothetical protein
LKFHSTKVDEPVSTTWRAKLLLSRGFLIGVDAGKDGLRQPSAARQPSFLFAIKKAKLRPPGKEVFPPSFAKFGNFTPGGFGFA